MYGLKSFNSAYRQSKRLSRFYDIAKRLVIGLGIKGKKPVLYKAIGNMLFKEVDQRNISLNRATLSGKEGDIVEAIRNSIPLTFASQIKDEDIRSVIKDFNIISRPKGPRGRNTFPIKRLRALSAILDGRQSEQRTLSLAEERISSLRGRHNTLLRKTQKELDRLQLGHKAYQAIMNAVYKTNPSKDLFENVAEMLNVITHWAWQVIGRSPRSEAAGWLAINPEGKIGIRYKYLRLEKNADLEKAEVYTLKKRPMGGQINFSETETTELVSDKRGNFITTAEWENLRVSDTYVAVEKEDGTRVLYRRTYKPGSQLVGKALRDKGKAITSAFAQGAVALIGKLKNFDNASVELREISSAKIELKQGEIIPFLPEGSSIKLVAAGSADPNLRQTKIEKGIKAQNVLGVGIIEQQLDRSVGNVRASALKPMATMISDVDNFHVRPQNRFLISIVGVHSYFIRSLIEFDSEGNAVCLGSLEVTNPEIIPKDLSAADRKVLLEQFEMGKIFAGLASTGIMVKTLREEIDRLTLQYLGPQVYQIVKNRDFARLKGTKVDDATIMFADISGFTSLSDKLQDTPGKVVSLLSTMFAELTPIIIKNGGMVDKYIGDAIMADWGVAEKSKDDVQNAVHTAIEFQMRLQGLNLREDMQRFYKEHDIPPLGISIGLNTGMAIAGNMGHEKSKIEFSVIGDAVNVAARLQGAASRGQVIIGEETFNALPDSFKSGLAVKFNAYNKNIKKLKEFILAEYKSEGRTIDETELDKKLQRYLDLYQDATNNNLFIPGVTWAKNKGAVPYYHVRWDKHAWRYRFLQQAGIELPSKSVFENQPPSPEEVYAAIEQEPPAKREALETVYEALLIGREIRRRSTLSS